MPTPSNTPPPSRLGMYNNPRNINRPRIKIHIPPPNLNQHNYPTFGAASPFLSTAHSNPSMQFSGAAPQWPSSPYPYVPDKGGLFKQFEGFKAWDWTRSGLNKGEKSVFVAYEKLSRWSKRWFTHFFLMTIVFLYSVIGAYLFVAIEGTEQEDITTTFNNLKINLSKSLYKSAQDKYIQANETLWEQEVTKKIDTFQVELIKLYKMGFYDIDRYHAEVYRGTSDFQFQKTWSFWNAMFYCGTIYTTIGYGHISPATTTGRAITIVYSIIGIPLFLILLADFGKLFTRGIKFVWAFVRRLYYTGSMRRVRKQAQVQEMLRGIEMAYEIATFRRPSMMMKQTDLERAQAATPNSSNVAATAQSETPSTPIPSEIEIDDEFNLPISVALIILITYILCGAAFYSISEGWSFFDACYFVFISMSTIGFGDFVPHHPIRMMCSIIYLIFGLALTSMCINVVQVKLSDSFRQASAKISATIGLTLAEEEARSSQNLTPVPENVSVHSYGKKNDTFKSNPDMGVYDNAEVRDGQILTKSDAPPPPFFPQKSPDQLAPPPGPHDKIKSNKTNTDNNNKQTRK